MINIFLIHGSYGSPEENWFPWLKNELESLGYRVFVPEFPTPENQSLESWMEVFEGYRKYINENTIFVGHSLGPAFILSIVEALDTWVKACFFVASFIELLGNEEFDKINRTFVEKDFDWQKIKENCKNFTIYHADNDPYVPISAGEKVAKNLDGDLQIIPNAGHFNTDAGYTKFEKLLDDVT